MSLSFVPVAEGQGCPPRCDAREEFEAYDAITCTLTAFAPLTGTLYLSSFRLVFIERDPSSKSNAAGDVLKCITLPLARYRDRKVVQPWFGANYYEGQVVPLARGGLDSLAGAEHLTARFAFNEGGIERFHKALAVAYSVARERHLGGRAGSQEEEALPVYESAGAGPGVPPDYQ